MMQEKTDTVDGLVKVVVNMNVHELAHGLTPLTMHAGDSLN